MLGTSLVRRPSFQDPLTGNALARLFGSNWSDDPFHWLDRPDSTGTGTWAPPVDLRHTDDGFQIEVDLPGLTKDQVEISVDDNVLTVSGERRGAEAGADDSTYRRVERWHGKFSRSFSLPHQVDAAKVKATFENGVLRIVLPKLEQARRRRIEIG